MTKSIVDAFIIDAIRTPFGRYAGALSSVRPDDLGAVPLKALLARNPQLNPELGDHLKSLLKLSVDYAMQKDPDPIWQF